MLFSNPLHIPQRITAIFLSFLLCPKMVWFTHTILLGNFYVAWMNVMKLKEWKWSLEPKHTVLLEILVIAALLGQGSQVMFSPPSIHHQLSEMRVLVSAGSPHTPVWRKQGRILPKGQRKTETGTGWQSTLSMWWEIHGCCSLYWLLLSRQRSKSIPRSKGSTLAKPLTLQDSRRLLTMPGLLKCLPGRKDSQLPVCIWSLESSFELWVNQCWGI